MADANKNGIDDDLEGYGNIATGDATTNSTSVKVPIYSRGSQWSGGKPIATKPGVVWGTSTVSSAVNNFAGAYSKGSPEAVVIANALVASGMVKPNASLKQMVSAYSSALTMTARMQIGGNKNVTVFDGMAYAGGGGAGSGSQAQTIKYFTTYTDAQVKQRATSAYQAILGRAPSSAEIKAFGKALRAGAKAAPAINKSSASGKTQTSQKGFDENAFIAGYMANHIPDPSKDLDGVAGQIQDLIDNYKENYGIKPSQSFINQAIKSVVGSDDPNGAKSNLEAQMKEQAQILFPALTEKINAGLSVRAIADPFISTYASLMEQNDMNIGLDNQEVTKALSSKNDKGEYQLMDIDSFARTIRAKDEWLNTRNAKETMLSAADGILKQFGFRR